MPKDTAENTQATTSEAADNAAAAEKRTVAMAKTGFDPSKVKVKQNLTLPLVKPKLDEPIYIRFDEACKIGKEIGDKDAAITAVIVDLQTGETMQYLVPAVFQGILHDEFGAPKWGTEKKGDPVKELEPRREGQEPGGYVGKSFMVTKHPMNGKKYHPMTIQEIEV